MNPPTEKKETGPSATSEHERDEDGEYFSEEDTSRMTDLCIEVPSLRKRDRSTLTVLSGNEIGRVYSVREKTTMGRAHTCTVHIDDASVSREHAKITYDEPGAPHILENLASRNGTFVNGNRIQRYELKDGDRIELGPTIKLRFGFADDEEERMLRKLYESSVRDPLTGAYNRKHFAERLGVELAYALRHRSPLSLVMIDIDHFKLINDARGHLAGDCTLRALSGVVQRTIRAEDVFARYGGEEFAVIVRGIDPPGVLQFAERLRSIVETTDLDYDAQVFRVTISLGVATLVCCGERPSSERLIAIADERLYRAKQTGRNRAVGPS